MFAYLIKINRINPLLKVQQIDIVVMMNKLNPL